MHDVGNIHEFASLGEKNGRPLLYLDGIKTVFTHKWCKPLFVLDSVEYLNPELLEEEDDQEEDD